MRGSHIVGADVFYLGRMFRVVTRKESCDENRQLFFRYDLYPHYSPDGSEQRTLFDVHHDDIKFAGIFNQMLPEAAIMARVLG